MHEEDHPMPHKIIESDTTNTMRTLHFSSTAPASDGSLANEPHNLLCLQGLEKVRQS